MPLPFILGGAAILATVIGASSHKDAKETNEQAQGVARRARILYNESKETLEKAQNDAEQKLLKLGYEKKNVLDGSMKQFVEAYDKIKNIQIKESVGLSEISNFEVEQQDVVQIKQMSDIYSGSIQSGAAGAATGAVIALAASGALPAITGTLSLAGTCLTWGSVGAAASIAGSAISTAFAATPLAAVVAPAVFFTGISASMKADENLDKAEEMYAEAERASEEMKVSETLCKAIGERSDMFYNLLLKLNGMFTECTNMLDSVIEEKERKYKDRALISEDFAENEIALIAVTRALAGAVKSIIDTPILSEDGKVSKESLGIYENSRKCLPDFSKTVHEIKCMQGEDTNIEHENVFLSGVQEIEEQSIRKRHMELVQHKLEMKKAKDSLFSDKSKNKFVAVPRELYYLDEKTKEILKAACKKFITDHPSMNCSCKSSTEIRFDFWDPNYVCMIDLVYEDIPSEHGWNGFVVHDGSIYSRNSSMETSNHVYIRQLAKAESIYILDGCIYADAELIGVCMGESYEQKEIKTFFEEIASIVQKYLGK